MKYEKFITIRLEENLKQRIKFWIFRMRWKLKRRRNDSGKFWSNLSKQNLKLNLHEGLNIWEKFW